MVIVGYVPKANILQYYICIIHRFVRPQNYEIFSFVLAACIPR